MPPHKTCGDVLGLGTVKTALANGEATVNTVITAGNAFSDLFTKM
jgi:hypothetical protein